jgi:hypothetical protein
MLYCRSVAGDDFLGYLLIIAGTNVSVEFQAEKRGILLVLERAPLIPNG